MTAPDGKRWRWCQAHTKRGWLDHAAARAALARVKDGAAMHVYACDEHAGTFHLGHRNRQAVALDRVTEAGRERTT